MKIFLLLIAVCFSLSVANAANNQALQDVKLLLGELAADELDQFSKCLNANKTCQSELKRLMNTLLVQAEEALIEVDQLIDERRRSVELSDTPESKVSMFRAKSRPISALFEKNYSRFLALIKLQKFED